MVRKIISVVAGVITGFIIVFIGDSVCQRLYSPHIDLNTVSKDAFSAYMASIPVYVLAIMFLFWMLSSFLGGLVAAKINTVGGKRSSIITGSILMAAAVLNMIIITHPVWMFIGALILYIPVAYLGGMTVSKK